MAPLIPIATTLAGKYIGGQLGSAIGWMVGAWVFGQLTNDDETPLDPGAEEMPRFNQALRGVIIPVYFGTNRVSSQITWQKNFTSIRNETGSGGGGKPGGSGGGKGGSQNTQIAYTYTWDVMYHVGMPHEAYSLYGGWLGPDKLADDTITAIQNSGAGTPFLGVDDDKPQNASLGFESSFFYSGEGNGSPTAAEGIEGWAHFATEEDGEVRFPHTNYIGFKAMDLGNRPHIPQLTWEIGPGVAEATFLSGFIGNDDKDTSITQADYGGTFVKDANGVKYGITGDSNGANAAQAFNLDTGVTTDFIDDSEFDAMATAMGLDPGTAYDFTSSNGGAALNEEYALLWGYDIGAVARTNWAFVLCTIDTDGTFTAVGGWQARANSTGAVMSEVLSIGICNSGSDVDSILIFFDNHVSTSHDPKLVTLPSISRMKGILIEDDTNNIFQTRQADLTADFGDFFGIHSTYGSYSSFGFLMPTADVTSGAVIYGTRLYFYIGKQDIQKHIDDPGDADNNSYIDGKKVSNPNGLMVFIDFGTVGIDDAVTYPTGIENADADFVTKDSDVALMPFEDAGESLDGTDDFEDDYFPRPAVHKLTEGGASGAWIVIFTKRFTDSTDLAPTGTYNKIRAFIYNPFSRKFRQEGTLEGSTIDTVDDMGAAGGNRYLYTTTLQVVFFDQANNSLVEFREFLSGDAALNDNFSAATFGTMIVTGGSDVLVPLIIYEILTNAWFGVGVGTTEIDTDSYEDALAYCDANDFRVSVQYRREASVLQVIEELLALYGGFLVFSQGKIFFKTQEFTSTTVRTIDNDHLVVSENGEPPVTISKGARQDSFNKVRVNYIDRALDYRQNQVEEQDEVDQDFNGVRMKEFPAKFVMQEQMARTMAERALWSNLYARDTYAFELGWKDADLEPGDVITLVDSFHTNLQGGVTARIATWREVEKGRFEVVAKQEFESIATTSGSILDITSAGFNDLIKKVPSPLSFRMYELPCEFQISNNGMTYVDWIPDEFAAGARLFVSADGVSYAPVQTIQPHPLGGRLLGSLPASQPGDFQENVEFVLFPKSDWTTTASTYFDATMNEALAATRAIGASLMWIGSEMIAYENVNLVGQNHYRMDRVYRGWGGTNIHNHNSGDFWTKQGGGIFKQEFNEDKIGTTISYKVAPFNLGGVEIDVASIEANTYTILGTHYRPQNASVPRFIQNSIDHRGNTKQYVNSEGDLHVDWRNSARKFGFGVGGHGSGTYGRFSAESLSWRVEVVGSGDTVVRSTSVSSPTFNYTNSNNFADNGDWRGNVAIKVTPYNEFGDAVRTSVISLELWA